MPHRPERVRNSSKLSNKPPGMPRGRLAQLKLGGKLFHRNYAQCHVNAGGDIPDLRQMDKQTMLNLWI